MVQMIKEFLNGAFGKVLASLAVAAATAAAGALWQMNGHMSAIDERIASARDVIRADLLSLHQRDADFETRLRSNDDRTLRNDLVRADALSAKDDKTRTEQICEADFYTGMFQVEKGATAEARQLLAAARKGCPPDFMEYEAAGQELKRLGFAKMDDRGQRTENR
jgi:hypothetical protein